MVQELYDILLTTTDPVEYEIRFGKQTNRKFRAQCTTCFYDTTLNSLEAFDEWDRVREKTVHDFFFQGLRFRRCSDGTSETCTKNKVITKTKHLIVSKDVQSFYPSDVRISIAKEVPVEFDKAVIMPEYVRTKQVKEFIKGNFCYVFSAIRSGSSLDDLGEPFFEVEIEILNALQYLRARGVPHVEKSILMKIRNILQGRGFVKDFFVEEL